MSARSIAPRLRGGAPLTGLLLKMPCAAQIEAAAIAGFDLVVLDTEHGPGGAFELEHHLRAAAAAGLGALVRTPNQDPAWIQAALDSGAAGIIVPHVLDVAGAQAVVAAAHYPPRGRRGLALTTRAGQQGGALLGDHLERAAEQTTVVIQIEDAEALAVLDELVSVDGVDAVLIGANDLSMSLGHPGRIDHPEVAGAIDAILAAAMRHGKSVMVIAAAPQHVQRARERGAGAILFVASQLVLAAFRSASGGGQALSTAIGPEPLVMVPGTACDHDLWGEVIAGLSDVADPRVARIDLDDSIASMAETILAAAPAHFALAGHSQGAVVCLEIVRRAPERVTRLALLNASARPGDDTQLASWEALRTRLEAPDDRSSVIRDLVAANLKGPINKRIAARMEAMAERLGRHGLLRQLAAQSSRPDSREGLAAIGCPTLVIAGADDRVCRRELPEELAAAIPGAKLEVIDGCGHMAPMECPQRVCALLREWLTGLGERK